MKTDFNAKAHRRKGAGIGTISLCVFVSLCLCVDSAPASDGSNPPDGMVHISGGVYCPLVRGGTDLKKVPVKAFYLDVVPISNSNFLEFVRGNRAWQRSHIKRIFADESYLKNWQGDLEPGTNAPLNAPVVYVSWFAARAYAHWLGKRLPTMAEWEHAAAASSTRPDGENDPAFKSGVLRWYADPAATELLPVGRGPANVYGVRDLHDLVWEWIADFNSAIVSGDSRDGSVDTKLFCGGGTQNSKNVENYPGFMRYAFRSGLEANYCIHNLGFRCAKDL